MHLAPHAEVQSMHSHMQSLTCPTCSGDLTPPHMCDRCDWYHTHEQVARAGALYDEAACLVRARVQLEVARKVG